MMKLINIIGTGKLGTTLGMLWAKTSEYRVHGIYNRNLSTSRTAIQQIGQGQICTSLTELPEADITLIAVPDDEIKKVCQTLYKLQKLKKNHLLFHCAGALPSSILKTSARKDILVGSVHPLKSFSHPINASQTYAGTLCAIEGSKEAQAILLPLFKAIDSKLFPVASNKKSLYHAGCVFASNYLISIAQQAIDCLEKSGVPKNSAKDCVSELMLGTLNNIFEKENLANILTGPVQRGDLQTIEQHLHSFSSTESKNLYQLLGLSLIKLTAHNASKKEALIKLLEDH
jgi:predicted short-subunit dehydrogenase-like oxidoreductase (DUF2520 family)